MDRIERYEERKWQYFFIALINAAEICQNDEYIQARYHKQTKGNDGVILGIKDDKTQERVEV